MRIRILCELTAAALITCVAAAAPTSSESLIAKEVERATTVSVGPGATGARVIRAQILLGCARFSPGEIDGRYGDDLGIAIKGYQENHALKASGVIDAEMWKLLDAHTAPLLIPYTIREADLKGPFDPLPKEAAEQAKLTRMGFESPEEGLGEKFHVSPALLAELNPGMKPLKAGERITVADVTRWPARRASRVVVSKSLRTVSALGAGGKLLAQYPATIGGEHDPLPIGNWKITIVSHDPWFNWDPVHFWNVDPDKAAEKLPPGPNNPVGVVWMGLSKEHYGIHGTPDPGHVRHGESYGCIRLTNWDAYDLSRMVVRGTPVDLEE